MKRTKQANVNASLYGTTFETIFECVGADGCALAQFFLEPPDPGDACAFSSGCCECRHPNAQRAALEKLRDAISVHLAEGTDR